MGWWLAVVGRQLPFRSRFNFVKAAASKTGEFTKKACSMGDAGSYFSYLIFYTKLDIEFLKDLGVKTR